MIDLRLPPLPELTLRSLRRGFVSYRKEAFPKYGEKLEKLTYRKFKELALFHDARYQELFQIYEHFPQAVEMPPEIRGQALFLEQEISRVEHLLCL
ncbi:MAG TPA: hypothetical protein DD435_09665 [Cyanobacteria bacterium UBA8530]|nr:hypothetical protein [Cyanobacteria bacterium UBA8530]